MQWARLYKECVHFNASALRAVLGACGIMISITFCFLLLKIPSCVQTRFFELEMIIVIIQNRYGAHITFNSLHDFYYNVNR